MQYNCAISKTWSIEKPMVHNKKYNEISKLF